MDPAVILALALLEFKTTTRAGAAPCLRRRPFSRETLLALFDPSAASSVSSSRTFVFGGELSALTTPHTLQKP